MSYDAATDPLLAGIAALVKAHANAELADVLGDDPAIEGLYQHPAPLSIVPSLRLPALSVNRGPTRYSEPVTGRTASIPIVFTYVAPATALAALGTRWPLLEAVWSKVLDAILAGGSDHYDGPDLAALGAIDVDVRTITKTEQYAEASTGTAFPAFVAQVTILVDTVWDLSTYERLREVFATYSLTQSEDGPATVIVEDLIEIAPQPAQPVDETEPFEDA